MEAWLLAVALWLQAYAGAMLPAELTPLGHMLGLPHGPGVMSGTDPAAQVNWDGWLDTAALGWI